jgi:hypothetical protein
MEDSRNPKDYKDRTVILRGIGALMLILGLGSAIVGPVEIYCFYLFSEGGRLHYEGFGFGCFMFANIACQILGYYLIAVVFIPLGYGQLKIRRWAKNLSLSMLWAWLVVGAPVTAVALFSLLSIKNYSRITGFGLIAVLGLLYFVVPWLAIRFYRSRSVKMTFEARDPQRSQIEETPVPILTLGVLLIFYAVIMHVPILLNGLFPFFGALLIVALAALAWGALGQRVWAWWGSLACFLLLALSSIATFLSVDYSEVLAKMGLPPTEMEILERLPLEGFHFALFVGIPLVLTLVVIVRSKRHFGVQR